VEFNSYVQLLLDLVDEEVKCRNKRRHDSDAGSYPDWRAHMFPPFIGRSEKCQEDKRLRNRSTVLALHFVLDLLKRKGILAWSY